ncbi:ANTAR domain-containing protein [Arthrobacter sp. SD76]|uniref:ANTAR domain-containing protein n=1 Tax=Arthrobacter sp. SD76 TaxID=3415007 RepID=UPI003C7914A1
MNFFASKPGAFTPDVYDKALGFAATARHTLHCRSASTRLRTAQTTSKQPCKAGQRSTWPVASSWRRTGAQAEAMEILTKVSSNRNRKLRDVATELIKQLSGGNIQTHFDR